MCMQARNEAGDIDISNSRHFSFSLLPIVINKKKIYNYT